MGYLRAFYAIFRREILRFVQQRSRFFSALVRPLVWLFIFSVSLGNVLGVSIIPPYKTYVHYSEYITPGLLGMIMLFNGMQSSLSMVYDREMGSMRALLIAPLPRSFVLASRLFSSTCVGIVQCGVYLIIAYAFKIQAPWQGYITVIPSLMMTGLTLGALGLFLASLIRQLENFAGVMNFVIFPMFFASSALYPLWKIKESSLLLYEICRLNPFTYAVESIRFGLYNEVSLLNMSVLFGCCAVLMTLALNAYNPKRGLLQKATQAS